MFLWGSTENLEGGGSGVGVSRRGLCLHGVRKAL